MRSLCASVADPARRAFILGLAPPPTRREQLAEFLRLLRERTSPESLGLPAANGARRRTPGLRREEVSLLAGVGVSWYTWLEQGREITPSASVLDALARVYSLTPAERGHLFDLAGVPIPAVAGPYPTAASSELAAWIDALHPIPAYLTNPRMDVLAHNRACAIVVWDPGRDGNLLSWLFTRPSPLDDNMAHTARHTLARFRVQHARRYDDPAFRELIEELIDSSALFRELWPRHEVLDHGRSFKHVEHPTLGPLDLHHLQTIPTTDPELRLVQLVPADAATRAALSAI